LLCLPLRGGAAFEVTQELVAHLQNQYPAVGVAQQFREMQAWLEANPRHAKTRPGVKRFINGWLARQQSQAPKPAPVSYLGPEDVL
jgi:hypothetical protein